MGGGWVDKWMDVSLGVWWLGGYIDGSVGGWWLVVGGYMDGCVGMWVMFRRIHGCMCRLVCGVWAETCMDVSVGL